tara:strand:+ start:1408 stop:1593 length:186 start_codon:yes stop_codon:yes gene_type:complete
VLAAAKGVNTTISKTAAAHRLIGFANLVDFMIPSPTYAYAGMNQYDQTQYEVSSRQLSKQF